MFVIDSKMCD